MNKKLPEDRSDKSVGIRINSGTLEYLKKLARQKSFELDKNITWVDLVRESIEEKFGDYK